MNSCYLLLVVLLSRLQYCYSFGKLWMNQNYFLVPLDSISDRNKTSYCHCCCCTSWKKVKKKVARVCYFDSNNRHYCRLDSQHCHCRIDTFVVVCRNNSQSPYFRFVHFCDDISPFSALRNSQIEYYGYSSCYCCWSGAIFSQTLAPQILVFDYHLSL